MRAIVWCVVAACGGVTARNLDEEPQVGPAGPAGPPGPQGPPGADGASATVGYRWVDATGVVVTSGPELIWIDPATGLVWSIDEETGAYESGPVAPVVQYFEQFGCVGDAQVAPYPPRVPFRMAGPDTAYMVRTDWDAVYPMCASSWGDGTHCTDMIYGCLTGNYVPVSGLVSTGVTLPPPSGLVGPLHREL